MLLTRLIKFTKLANTSKQKDEMNIWKLTKSRLSAVLVTAITAGLLGPVAVVSPAVAQEAVRLSSDTAQAGQPSASLGQAVFSTKPGQEAAPHVAGVAAQALEVNPGMSPSAVASLITTNASEIGFYQVDGDPDGLLFGGFLVAPEVRTISGTLSYYDYDNGDVDPITDGHGLVSLYSDDDLPLAETYTDVTGFYSFTDIPPGTYYLKAGYDGETLSVVDEWHMDQPSRAVANTVTVDATDIENLDIMLAPGGSIGGYLRTYVDGRSNTFEYWVDDAVVCAFPVSPSPDLLEGQDYWCSGPSNSDGYYTISDLPNGHYKLRVDTSAVGNVGGYWAPQYVSGGWIGVDGDSVVATFDEAETHSVEWNGEYYSDGDALLTVPAIIRGEVSYYINTTSNIPDSMSGVEVELYDEQGNLWGSTFTDEGGEYLLNGVSPGTYYLRATDVNGNYTCFDEEGGFCGNIAPEYFSDQADFAVATPIVIASSGNLGSYNVNLAYGASIRGTVTNATTSTVVPWVEVCAFITESVELGCVVTDDAGNYDLSNLPNGDYRLYFSGEGLLGAWLGASGPVSSYANAAAKTVSAKGLGLTAQDVALVVPPSINGQVTYFPTTTSTSSIPMVGVTVEILDEQGNWLGSTETDENGDYSILSQGSGIYYLYAYDSSGMYPKDESCWDTGEECVDVASEYYSDKPDLEVATPITVGSDDLTGYNLSLAYGASIKGKVTKTTTSTVAAGVQVCPFITESVSLGCSDTDDAGNYDLANLPNGVYRLHFSGEGLRDAWLGTSGPVSSYALAATKTVSTKGLGLTAQNVTLVEPPSIKGQVTYTGVIGENEDSGEPIRGTAGLFGATVEIYDSATGDYVDSVETDGDGNYIYIPEGPGSFKLWVDPSFADYFGDYFGEPALAPEWFTNVPDISLATVIPFTTATLTGKNINLAPVATISGAVSYLSGGEDIPVGGVDVCAYFSATLESFACGTSDETGLYLIEGLPNGAYKLKFDTSTASVPLTTSWLGSSFTTPVATYALATTQTITAAGVSLVNKNLRLPLGTLTTALPTISGTASVGSTLTGDPGEWGPEGVALSYEWLRGTTVVGSGVSYEVQDADVGQSLTFKVTGVMEYYTPASRTSAAVIGGYAWEETPAPEVLGTAKFGQTLTANEGSWLPTPTSFTYQWMRGVDPISGATGKTYVLQPADIGHPVTVKVTGVKTNYVSSPQTSEPTGDVEVADYSTAPIPTVTGNLNVGQVLTAVPGVWAPVPTSFTYQWRRDGGDISSATASTYTLTADDLGEQMSVVVTAVKSGYASTMRTSASSASVAAALFTTAPVPTITGTVKVGSTLTGVPGTWNPVVSSSDFGWVWSSSSSATGTYTAIDGATASAYVLRAEDQGKFIKVTVTGVKSGFVDTPRTSVATASVAAGTFATPPIPTITGTKTVGQTLTANEGTWSPTTDSYTYQWSSAATATGTYAPILGATGKTYELASADRGKFVKVAVTGVKAGFTSATTLSAAMTSGVVSAFTTAPTPTITGTVRVGERLTAVPGSWSPVPAFTYQWKRTVGDVTTNISGATLATYVLTAADYDAVISVDVKGTLLTYETTTKTSSGTEAVAAGVFTTAPTPTITGSAQSSQTLTAVPGTWAPVATFTYQWLADEEVIAGATAATLPLTTGMVGKQISVAVTGAATRYTSQTKTSLATAAVTLPLIPAAPTPVISGTVKVGSTLTVAAGTAPSGATVKSTQWSSAATLTGSFTPIEGATSSTYVLTADDRTRFVRVTVTWQKSGNGDTPKTATTIAVAAGTFATPPIPTITGTKTVGQTLTANRGTWTTAADTYTYTWSRASVTRGPYTTISGATTSTYTLQSDDLGKFIKVSVTGTKSGYTNITSGLSVATTVITAG